MIIRDLEAPDIPRARRLVKHLWAASDFKNHTDFDVDSPTVENTLRSMAAMPDACVKVATVEGRILGLGAALAHPCHWNANHIIAQQIFWWVEPEATNQGIGSGLIRHMELWAKNIGADTFVMSHQVSHDLSPMFEKLGYHPVENWHMRTL